MKRIIILMLFASLMFSVSALNLETTQGSNIINYYDNENGNSIINVFAGSINSIISVDNNGTINYTYDYSQEFEEITSPFYLVYQNNFPAENITIYYRGDLNTDPSLYIQELTMNDVGNYYFYFEPDVSGEVGRIYIDIPDAQIGTIRYIEEKPQGFNEIIGGIVGWFETIADINIQIWRVTFYLGMTFIIGMFVAGLFGTAFAIHRYREKVKKEAGMLSFNKE